MAMLKRENLLTRAKLNALFYDHITGERQLRKLKTELRQVGILGGVPAGLMSSVQADTVASCWGAGMAVGC